MGFDRPFIGFEHRCESRRCRRLSLARIACFGELFQDGLSRYGHD
jgi:hypothetical protein